MESNEVQNGIPLGTRPPTRRSGGRRGPISTVTVTADSITVVIPHPDTTATGTRSELAALLAFAARVDSFEGLVRWHRYEAVHACLRAKAAEQEAERPTDVYTRFYDPITQTAASYAALAGVTQFTAELFLDQAIACHDRIPRIGQLLRAGELRTGWFLEAVTQTRLVDDQQLLDVIDAEAAVALREAGHLTRRRVADIVARIVAEHDPDAAAQTLDAARRRRKVTVAPLGEGLSDLIITADSLDAQLSAEVLDAVIDGVCPNDPRTRGERRSDAAIARIQGRPFTCACDDERTCTAELAPDAVADRCAGIVLHVVTREQTLTGQAEIPGYADGHGPISAARVRDVAGRPHTRRRSLELGDLMDGQSRPGDGHQPTAACDTAVRAVFGHCSWPGCHRPAWRADLDHVCEYDANDPVRGGPTCHCNLNPKCRFHHGLKTHTLGWLDDQTVDANGVIWTEVTTPEGHTIRSRAPNTWLLPELGLIPCRHAPSPVTHEVRRPGVAEPVRTLTRTRAKHEYRIRMRAANRRHRERSAVLAAADPPPF